MRLVGGFLMVLAAMAYIADQAVLRAYHLWTTAEVERKYDQIHLELETRDANMTLPEGGMDALKRMREEEFWLMLEVYKRKARGDFLLGGLGGLGALMILSTFIRFNRHEKLKHSYQRASGNYEVSIPEVTPREEYVDEWEFKRREEGGFRSREQAVEWIRQDPLLACDYCGAKLRPTLASEHQGLELVTFYKKVPEGAKDLRIILGSLWFAKTATELKCTGCDRVVNR